MKTFTINANLIKARNWNKDKVRTLGGAYACALKNIYGDTYVHVGLYRNRKAYYERQNTRKLAIFESELT
jgi:hypothetical protein